jgi:hypothetical protein
MDHCPSLIRAHSHPSTPSSLNPPTLSMFNLTTLPLRLFDLLYSSVVPEGNASSPGAVEAPAGPITGPTPSPLAAIAGTTIDLRRDVTPFNVVVSSDSKSGAVDLYAQLGIRAHCRNRLSAEILGSLRVSLVIEPASNVTAVFASGVVALRAHTKTPKTDFAVVAQYPLAVAITSTLVSTQVVELQFPPEIRRNVLIQQTIGYRPNLLFSFHTVGVKTLNLIISGQLHLSGMGEVDF